MKTHYKNILIFFYTYFSISIMIVFVNVYLPVYFLKVLNVNEMELAFVQIFAYSIYFIKPVLGVYFDKKPLQNRLIYVILTVALLVSFAGFLFGAKLLTLFGLFLGVNFAIASILDILIDKQLMLKSDDLTLDESLRIKRKNIYIGATQMGALMATIILSLSYFVMFSDLQSLSTWTTFFSLGIILSLPLPFIYLFNAPKGSPKVESASIPKVESVEKGNRRDIVLLCVFGFLWGSSNIFQYPFEPWIVEAYGESSFSLYSLIMTFIVLIYAISVIVASKTKISDRKRLMVVGMILSGALYIIAPYSGFYGLIVCMALAQILAGFLLISYIAILMKVSNRKVAIYQLIAISTILAKVILVPLGTLLYGMGVSGGSLAVVAGIMFALSSIPMYFTSIKKE